MDIERSSLGVTEGLGTVLLLLIAVSVFSVIYVSVLSNEGPPVFTESKIVSTVEGLNIVLEHQGGHPISINTSISLSTGAYSRIIYPEDYIHLDDGDNLWGIGERIVIPIAEIRPMTCMYGTTTLDYEAEEIEAGGGGNEADFSDIVENYNGPTNLSDIDVNIQWGSGYTIADITAIDPLEKSIVFMGQIDIQHLLDYQRWEFAPGVNSVNLTFEFVDGKGGNTNTFLYYFDEGEDTVQMVNSIHNKGTPEGYTYNLTISVADHDNMGFGITSNDGHDTDYWYTGVSMNANGMKQALVYDIGQTALGPIGSYMIGFEDLDRSGPSDNDFQDMIVIVHVVSYE